MSSVDFSNPQVLRNYLLSRMEEGNGVFEEVHNVVVFKDSNGDSFIAPPEMVEKLRAQGKLGGKKSAKTKAPKVAVEESEEVEETEEAEVEETEVSEEETTEESSEEAEKVGSAKGKTSRGKNKSGKGKS